MWNAFFMSMSKNLASVLLCLFCVVSRIDKLKWLRRRNAQPPRQTLKELSVDGIYYSEWMLEKPHLSIWRLRIQSRAQQFRRRHVFSQAAWPWTTRLFYEKLVMHRADWEMKTQWLIWKLLSEKRSSWTPYICARSYSLREKVEL